MKLYNDRLVRRDFLKGATRATAAVAASAGIGLMGAPRLGRASEPLRPLNSRISYFCNGEIHVNQIGKPEGTPLTTGHMDFKPSWSKTDNMLICFRRTKNDPVTVNWKSAIFVINVDGTGFHQLSDGTRTDFNPTWTRDGLNTPIWNRKNDQKGGFVVMQSKVGGKPGEEVALTDERFHNWAHSCLTDGRILVNAAHPKLRRGVFLMTRTDDGKPRYERIQWELGAKGQMHRASISPSEKKICFEYLARARFTEPGHTLHCRFRRPGAHDYKPQGDCQPGRQTDLVRLSPLDRRGVGGGVSLRGNWEEPALRLPLGRRLDPADIYQPPRRLPLSIWRSGSLLKTMPGRYHLRSAGQNMLVDTACLSLLAGSAPSTSRSV